MTSTSEPQSVIQHRVDDSDVCGSASQFMGAVAPSDSKGDEQRKWSQLHQDLKAGMEASEDEFLPLDADAIIAMAKKRKTARGG